MVLAVDAMSRAGLTGPRRDRAEEVQIDVRHLVPSPRLRNGPEYGSILGTAQPFDPASLDLRDGRR